MPDSPEIFGEKEIAAWRALPTVLFLVLKIKEHRLPKKTNTKIIDDVSKLIENRLNNQNKCFVFFFEQHIMRNIHVIFEALIDLDINKQSKIVDFVIRTMQAPDF